MLQPRAEHAVAIASALTDRKVHNCKDLAQACHISTSYAEMLLFKMRKAGLIIGQRGPGGGYWLARSADEINLSEVVSAVTMAVDSPLSRLARSKMATVSLDHFAARTRFVTGVAK